MIAPALEKSTARTGLDGVYLGENNEPVMELKIATLAEYASVSQDGKLNILGIFDQLITSQLPIQIPLFYLVISYEAGPAEFDTQKNVGVVLLDGDGNPLATMEQQVTVVRPSVAGVRSHVNQIIAWGGLTFTRSGPYHFSIQVSGEERSTVPLHIHYQTSPGMGDS